jgi:chromosomal replication initiation ATPase DnaA
MPNSRHPRQLALALPHSQSYAREDFLSGPSNAVALALVDGWPDWPARTVALVGPEGSGKSHLADVWAVQAGARCISSSALQEASVPGALATGAVVIEDVAENSIDERALFHLLNLAREEGTYALLTMRSSPAGWKVALRDLDSRLRALPVITLAPPDDALLRALLVKLFADRQIVVEDNLITYLVTRMERSCRAACDAVAELDREALRRKRPVTRALAVELYRERLP